MKTTFILFFFSISYGYSIAQIDSLPEVTFDSRTHFSGSKGKWRFSGEQAFIDDHLIYESYLQRVPEDSTLYFMDKKWFYPNQQLKKHIEVNFKSQNYRQGIL